MMKRVLEGVEAVLFDLDGTLVETNIDFPLMKREMLSLAKRYRVGSRAVQSRDILGMIQDIEDTLSADGRPDLALQARDEAYAKLEEIELVHSRNATEMSNARRLLQLLSSRGTKIGIVTRNSRTASELSLKAAGMDRDILMLSREDVARTKPHPQHLLSALERLDAAPESAVMVGDHLMDMAAGKAAGMRTIGLLPPKRPRNFFDVVAPDIVITDLQEIIDALVDLDR